VRYAIDVAPLGPLSDPATVAELAAVAEGAGWDGVSVWDSLGTSIRTAAADPFIALAAAAAWTTRIRLITSVVALTRRRPQLVAQSAATLDRWSGGRLILGVGSGGDVWTDSFAARPSTIVVRRSPSAAWPSGRPPSRTHVRRSGSAG
jgi:alkanesulfonate monooxygenase SsuD/methylene tetrahydromethanopterin reductase-like flavin-dependent oxidoreductase (luciferase family)